MYSPWGPWGWSPYYGRYWGRSWYDPFWGPWGWDQPEVYSYTVYSSFLSMKIMRTGGGDRVFEGRAETQIRSDDLTTLVPNLVKAMFTNFPGRSGETVKVKIPQSEKRSEEHTSELQSLMRISYAVFCLKNKRI